MLPKCFLPASVAFVLLPGSSAVARPLADPLRFFEGRTESTGTIKIMLKRAARTHSVGHGRVGSDGALSLVQHVDDEGKQPFERRWRIRQIAPSRYFGSMSQAVGPVVIDEVDGRYRFQFKMKGNLSVEEWIAPYPDGLSARTHTIVRKFGMKVAAGEAIIRKRAAR